MPKRKRSDPTAEDGDEEKEESLETKQTLILQLWKEFVREPTDQQRSAKTLTEERTRKKKTYKCPLPDCSGTYTTHQGLLYHYKHCGLDLAWKCAICPFKCKVTRRGLVSHLHNVHGRMLPPLPPELETVVRKERPPTAVPTKGQKLNVTETDRLVRNQKMNRNREIRLDESLYFHQTHYIESVFTNWLPKRSSWTLLETRNFLRHLPQAKESPKFKTSTNPNHDWMSLKLFDLVKSKYHITFFTGGPIWSSAWCPIPMSLVQQSQYVSIATCVSNDATHSLNDTDPEPGMIQIWKVGQLTLTFSPCGNPKFVLGICHNYGIIWAMEWCPGGTTYQAIDQQVDSNSMARLGLLAIACGDGRVRILSIPHPETLSTSIGPMRLPIYKAKPVVILEPPMAGPATNYDHGVCRCLSWLKVDSQYKIAAGYGSGLVAVWHLNETSSLFVAKRSATWTKLRPRIVWQASGAAVLSVKWGPLKGGNFVATTGIDRHTRIWNVEDLCVALPLVRKSIGTCLDWSSKWGGIFMGFDECYNNFQANVTFKDFDYSSTVAPHFLTSHKSCVWDMCMSDWINSEASVDSSGEAVIFPNFRFRLCAKSLKRRLFERTPLYRIECRVMQEQKPKSNGGTADTDGEGTCRTYSEACGKYGLLFVDSPLDKMEKVDEGELKRLHLHTGMNYQRLSDYPLVSLTQVKWNPNNDAYTWLLTCGQVGLCRLSCVEYAVSCKDQL